jgi:phage shock protein C
METKLYRSRHGVIGGVCAGLAKYWNCDEAIVRVVTLLGALLTVFPFTLIYIISWIVIPKEPKEK